MIRKCGQTDLKQLLELAYKKNNEEEHNSAFCYKQYDSIQKEFSEFLDSEDNFILGDFKEDKLNGLITFYVDKEMHRVDCIGPFIEEDYIVVGQELLEYAKKFLDSSYKFEFYFNVKNVECLELMKNIGAEDNGNEKILNLKKEDYILNETLPEVKILSPNYYDKLIALHDSIFPGVYLSGKGVIKSIGKDRKVIVIVEKKEIVAYGVFKFSSNSATAEFVAVNEKFRGKGYGKAILNGLALEAFVKNDYESIDLVVDNVNDTALKLYYGFGFKLKVENYYYKKSYI